MSLSSSLPATATSEEETSLYWLQYNPSIHNSRGELHTDVAHAPAQPISYDVTIPARHHVYIVPENGEDSSFHTSSFQNTKNQRPFQSTTAIATTWMTLPRPPLAPNRVIRNSTSTGSSERRTTFSSTPPFYRSCEYVNTTGDTYDELLREQFSLNRPLGTHFTDIHRAMGVMPGSQKYARISPRNAFLPKGEAL